jgi:hypothetical protein
VNAAEVVTDPTVADTVAVDPGFAHGVRRSSCVVATPAVLVVAVAGVSVAPDGAVNDTAAPGTAAPVDVVTAAVMVIPPDAGTCMFAAVSARVFPDTAKAGVVDTRATAGTAHAAPVTIVRRLTWEGVRAGERASR